MRGLRQFCFEEQGQDLIESTLIVAFVVLASAAIFMGTGAKITPIWGAANSALTNPGSTGSVSTGGHSDSGGH